jgi:glucose-1-phosphate adenylyltransferase
MLDAGAHAAVVYNKVSNDVARGNLGVLTLTDNSHVQDLQEKPDRPIEIPGEPGWCYGNLALYAFTRECFVGMLDHIAEMHAPEDPLSTTGIPWAITCGAVGYDLATAPVPDSSERERRYFEDIGTLDRYFDAALRACATDSPFDWYARSWPIIAPPQQPNTPAKVDSAIVRNVLLGPDAIVQHRAKLTECVISRGVQVGEGSCLERCVLLDNVRVGRDCTLTDVVIDKQPGDGITVVPGGTVLSPSHLPQGTLPFAEAARLLNSGVTISATAVLSECGRLFIPSTFRFTS